MSQPENIKIILSGGGTGGHIFPAIAIANAIKSLQPNADILFVGAKGRMEMEKVPAAGYEIVGLNISGFQRSLSLRNLSFPFKVLGSLWQARAVIKKFHPNLVIGTGGYASGPTLRMAALMGIPIVIQEQNSFPGVTNKMLASKARLICVAYPGMDKYFPAGKIRETGNPVRSEIERQNTSKTTSLIQFGLDSNKSTVLVVGGSLGARTINRSIAAGLDKLASNNIQLIWQTGKLFADEASSAVAPYAGKGMLTMPFITEMSKAYSAADVVVSRAGAIAISELCVAGKPSILVPSPNVAEDHQTKNASVLAAREAAIMISDAEAQLRLTNAIIDLANDAVMQKNLSINISKMAHYKAAEQIAELALSLISK